MLRVQVVDAAESLTAVETCCRRVDVLEDTVVSLTGLMMMMMMMIE